LAEARALSAAYWSRFSLNYFPNPLRRPEGVKILGASWPRDRMAGARIFS
jgi:hypothetical protein